jgi:ABC-type branched-subunit amino acid transport system permease subunit
MLWDIFLYVVLAAWLVLWLLREHGFVGMRRGALFRAARRDAQPSTRRRE